jgi:CTP:phosphocholine cytidylyltransferase-like protein
MNTQNRLRELKIQLEEIYSVMPETFFQQKQRDKSAFLISKEIEQLENPESYAENSNHWDNHEIHL